MFERSTRAVALTTEGEALLARVAPALSNISSALADCREAGGSPAGRLRITASRVAAQSLLASRLAAFTAAYPRVELEIQIDDGLADIVRDGFDAGIRLHEQLDPGSIAVRLSGPQRMIAVASPEFLARYRRPAHPRDLTGLPCIGVRLQSGQTYRWEFGKDGMPISLKVEGPLILNDDELVIAACCDGAGIAFLFRSSVEKELRAGRLVTLLEDWCPPFSGFWLYHSSRCRVRPALRAFIDWFRATDPPPDCIG